MDHSKRLTHTPPNGAGLLFAEERAAYCAPGIQGQDAIKPNDKVTYLCPCLPWSIDMQGPGFSQQSMMMNANRVLLPWGWVWYLPRRRTHWARPTDWPGNPPHAALQNKEAVAACRLHVSRSPTATAHALAGLVGMGWSGWSAVAHMAQSCCSLRLSVLCGVQLEVGSVWCTFMPEALILLSGLAFFGFDEPPSTRVRAHLKTCIILGL